METPPSSVLFVCMGNICRSPAAEIIFRKLVTEAGASDRVRIDSAGTIRYHQGAPPDSRMSAALKARGYKPEGHARHIKPEDLASFDLIVTMDEENLHYVEELASDHPTTATIRPLVSFCTTLNPPRVPDPYYGGASGFDHVIDILEDGCQGILSECGIA